jgi:hypothetical protein
VIIVCLVPSGLENLAFLTGKPSKLTISRGTDSHVKWQSRRYRRRRRPLRKIARTPFAAYPFRPLAALRSVFGAEENTARKTPSRRDPRDWELWIRIQSELEVIAGNLGVRSAYRTSAFSIPARTTRVVDDTLSTARRRPIQHHRKVCPPPHPRGRTRRRDHPPLGAAA